MAQVTQKSLRQEYQNEFHLKPVSYQSFYIRFGTVSCFLSFEIFDKSKLSEQQTIYNAPKHELPECLHKLPEGKDFSTLRSIHHLSYHGNRVFSTRKSPGTKAPKMRFIPERLIFIRQSMGVNKAEAARR